MTDNYPMLKIASYFDIVSAILSTIFNVFLIFLILTKSPKQFGAYKYLMVFISVFEIAMAFLQALLVPINYSHGSAVAVMINVPTTPFSPLTALILLYVFITFSGASFAIFAIHFIYRYLTLSGNPLIKSFESWKVLFWFLLPLCSGLSWSIASHFLCSPNQQFHDYLRDSVLRDFKEHIENFEYRIFYLYKRHDDGTISFNTKSLVALGISFSTVTFSLFIIFYFGFKCYSHIGNLMKKSTRVSSQFNAIQQQLFNALVVQTVIPVLLVHVPTTLMFIWALLEIDVGNYVSVVSMSIALYSVLDPLPSFFIIKPYRKALLDYFKCQKLAENEISVQRFSNFQAKI